MLFALISKKKLILFINFVIILLNGTVDNFHNIIILYLSINIIYLQKFVN